MKSTEAKKGEGMIEWSEDIQLEGWVGIVGGLPILEVTIYDSNMFGYTVWERQGDGDELDSLEKWEAEKEKLSNHFKEWLDKAGLMVKPKNNYCQCEGEKYCFWRGDKVICNHCDREIKQ